MKTLSSGTAKCFFNTTHNHSTMTPNLVLIMKDGVIHKNLLSPQADQRGEAKPAEESPLLNTAWKLLKIEYSDGTVHRPDDPTKYTLEFSSATRLAARIDCNRGNGSWKSPEPGKIEFGMMAMTRAACPPGSLDVYVMRDLEKFRSYLLKDDQLYLSLKADGARTSSSVSRSQNDPRSSSGSVLEN